jgi:DNA topoisomerase-1
MNRQTEAREPAYQQERQAAREAQLRYVSDRKPGIRREREGDGFRYIAPDGERVRDGGELRRIAALAIPPAWTDVWICPLANGHLQATGRDARGRKQYRYHSRWRAARDETKYARLVAFGLALPAIRERVRHDLALPGLPREKVLAAVVDLLDRTSIRVGNEEYARENRSYGLTTLRDRHVRVEGNEIRFRFRGKSGKEHRITLRDRRLATIVRRCRDLPGYELFQYVDEAGNERAVDAGDVNDYLRELAGDGFTAKDFRTWNGTVAAALALQASPGFDSEAQAKSNIVRAIEQVAARLGNTPAVCRKCYVHPAVIEAYLDGELAEALRRGADDEYPQPLAGLEPEVAAVLTLLQARLEREPRSGKRAS